MKAQYSKNTVTLIAENDLEMSFLDNMGGGACLVPTGEFTADKDFRIKKMSFKRFYDSE